MPRFTPSPRRFRHQRGSALLIVFVFAAIVAIMLLQELPVVVFEAQRNKEQLLMDRGNEYSQAVKLYLRKTQQYPPNLEALENTNRTRFLRKKFKDPFTDKAEWRLLHAGPNGIIIDSKVKSTQDLAKAGGTAPLGTFNNNNTGQNTPFGGTSPGNAGFNSGFNSGNNGGFNSSNNNQGFNSGNNQGFNGGNPAGANSSGSGGFATAGNTPVAGNPNPQTGPLPVGGDTLPTNPDGTVNPNARANSRSQIATGTNGTALGVIDPSQPPPSGVPSTPATGAVANPNTAVGGLLSTPNPSAPTQPGNAFNTSSGGGPSSAFGSSNQSNGGTFGNNFSSSSGQNANSNPNSRFGQLQGGGGIAGIASKVERHSIKALNEQQDYSLWEFFYDPAKDPARNALGAALSQSGGTNGAQPGIGTQPQRNNNSQSSPFGSNNQSSPFGSNNQNSSFGNSGNRPNSGGFGGFNSSPNTNNQGTNTQQQTAFPQQSQPQQQQQPYNPPQ